MQPSPAPGTGETTATAAALSDAGPPGVVEALIGRALWLAPMRHGHGRGSKPPRPNTASPRPISCWTSPPMAPNASWPTRCPGSCSSFARNSERQRVEYRGRISRAGALAGDSQSPFYR